ncbi:MAG: PaaI family thioesterase [Flavobacteriaceae bacterium]
MDVNKILFLLNESTKNTLMETLEIKYTFVGDGEVHASMPVNSRVHQPMGLLHGGASVALAESVGSAASHMFLEDRENFEVRGIEISANHLKSVREGMVIAKAKIIHKGRTTHLWEIRIEDTKGALVSLCKLTNIVLPKRK